MPDITVDNEGTIMLFHLHTDAATDWVNENVSDDAQHFGDALVVEHRFAYALASGMLADGLAVE